MAQIGLAARLQGSWQEKLADSLKRAGVAGVGGMVLAGLPKQPRKAKAQGFAGAGGVVGGSKGQGAGVGVSASTETGPAQIMKEVLQVWKKEYKPLRDVENLPEPGRSLALSLNLHKDPASGAGYYEIPEIMSSVRHYFKRLSPRDIETVKSHLWGLEKGAPIDIYQVADTFQYLTKGDVEGLRKLNRQSLLGDPQYRLPKDAKDFQKGGFLDKVIKSAQIGQGALEFGIDNSMEMINAGAKPVATAIKWKLPEGLIKPGLAKFLNAHDNPNIRAIYYTLQNLDPTQVPASFAAISEKGAWRRIVPGMVELGKRAANGDVDAVARFQSMWSTMLITGAFSTFAPSLLARPLTAATKSLIAQAKPVILKGITGISEKALFAVRKGNLSIAAAELSMKSGMSLAEAQQLIKGLDQSFDEIQKSGFRAALDPAKRFHPISRSGALPVKVGGVVTDRPGQMSVANVAGSKRGSTGPEKTKSYMVRSPDPLPGFRSGTNKNQFELARKVRLDYSVKSPKAQKSKVYRAVAEDFRRNARSRIEGKHLESPLDLATVAQVLRDPRIETFRFVFTKGDVGVGHEAFSQRLPGSSALFDGPIEELPNWIRKKLKEYDADGFYGLHNHPSGDPTPSDFDVETTEYLSQLPEFRAHVIIDSNKYVELTRQGEVLFHNQKFFEGDDPILQNHGHPFFGNKLTGAEDIANFGRGLSLDKNSFALFGLDSQRVVRAAGEYLISDLENLSESVALRQAASLSRLARKTGSRDVYIVMERKAWDRLGEPVRQRLRDAKQNGLIAEVVDTEGLHMFPDLGTKRHHGLGRYKPKSRNVYSTRPPRRP